MNPARINGLYAITPDISDTSRLLNLVDAALQGGIDVLQYRNKSPDQSMRLQHAREILAMCRAFDVPLIINDDIELAIKIGADGVHLGADDGNLLQARHALGKDFLLGASCYNQLTLALQAAADGASYVAFGSMFGSITKPAAVKAPLSLLADAKTALACPVVAIGGVGLDNIGQIASSGADAAAIITDLFDAKYVRQRAIELRAAFLLQTKNGH